MNPHFSIGPITVYYYGLILAAAILVGYLYARRRAKQSGPGGIDPGIIDAVLLVLIPLGIVGARLYFVAFSWDYFRTRPSEILALQDGGLAIHGALIGGALGLALLWLYYRLSRKTKFKLSTLLDVLAPVLPLAQAIGRLANYVNREAFGTPTELPIGIYIPPSNRPPQYRSAEYFHPTFAYEALWNLIGLALILALERAFKKRHRSPQGLLFAVYLGWYSLGRFWIEALRTDALLVSVGGGSARIAQIVSVLGVLGSLAFIWYRLAQWRAHKRPTRAGS